VALKVIFVEASALNFDQQVRNLPRSVLSSTRQPASKDRRFQPVCRSFPAKTSLRSGADSSPSTRATRSDDSE